MELKEPLLRRALLYQEEGEWGKADDYCEQVLDKEPENAYAYVIKLMARVKVDKVEMLGSASTDYEQWNSYRNACRFADEELKAQLNAYLAETKTHIQKEEQRKKEEAEAKVKEEWNRKREATYQEGLQYAREGADLYDLAKAKVLFEKASGYKDADAQAESCKERIAALNAERALLALQTEKKEKKRRIWVLVIVVVIVLALAGWWIYGQNVVENREKAKAVAANLPETVFFGTETDYVMTGERVRIAKEVTEYTRTIRFRKDGSVVIEVKERYDKEPFITQNGERQWDKTKSYTEMSKWSNVEVSFSGKITVKVGEETCTLKVDSSNKPTTLVMDGVTYNLR